MNIVHDTLAKCKTHRKVFICDIMGELATGDWTKRLGDWETSDTHIVISSVSNARVLM